MSVLAIMPTRFPAWLGHLFAHRRRSGHARFHARRAELERALALAQMPEHLRRDLNIDGGARLARSRDLRWPMW